MKVLAVDDEKNALENLINEITKAVLDVSITGFRNCNEAIEFAKTNELDVAFLDIRMREMSGIILAKKLKLINPKLNIIFTTGYGEYSREAFELHASGYIMKPVTAERIRQEMDNLRYLVQPVTEKRVRANTFGNFELFVDGSPVKFKYNKTKELIAYLIDRQGALCSMAEIISVLWEDDDGSHESYMKNLRADLIQTFKELNCEDIIVKQWGKLGIVKENIRCDYYDWINGEIPAINAYNGEYMVQYSWSEMTHGMIEGGRK